MFRIAGRKDLAIDMTAMIPWLRSSHTLRQSAVPATDPSTHEQQKPCDAGGNQRRRVWFGHCGVDHGMGLKVRGEFFRRNEELAAWERE